MDPFNAIIDYEEGNLTDEGTVDLFQYLIDSELAWSLQGCYGRTAMDLILSGLCHRKEVEQWQP